MFSRFRRKCISVWKSKIKNHEKCFLNSAFRRGFRRWYNLVYLPSAAHPCRVLRRQDKNKHVFTAKIKILKVRYIYIRRYIFVYFWDSNVRWLVIHKTLSPHKMLIIFFVVLLLSFDEKRIMGRKMLKTIKKQWRHINDQAYLQHPR